MDKEKKYELYVEGVNDKCVIASIGYQRGVKPSHDKYELKFGEHLMSIKCDKNGRNNNDATVFNLLRDALTIPQQYGAVAVVVDADDFNGKRAEDRVNKFLDIIAENNKGNEIYDLNIKLSDRGILLVPKESYQNIFPKVGLWIMPNNNETGAIESFLWQSGPKADYQDTYNEVDKIVTELERRKNPKIMHYIENHRNKALVHTFLAWIEDPGNPMGTSVDKKCWNIQNALVESFFNWLDAVYR